MFRALCRSPAPAKSARAGLISLAGNGVAVVAARIAVLILLGDACAPTTEPGTGVLLSGPTMGTRYSVRVDDGGATAEEAAIGALIDATLERIDRKMSTYRADSEISELNRAPANQPIALSPETVGVLSAAIDLAADSGGAFDVTAGPLINAWGFGPSGRVDAPPSDRLLASALRHVGTDKIAVDVAAGTATKLDADAYVDLSGIAKGYAVDAVVAALATAGWRHTMVEVGGEVRASGRTAFGRSWRIAIEQPDLGAGSDPPIAPLAVALVDGALATSANYRNFYFLGDTPVGHTIDPRTGRPVAHDGASVSVMAADCMTADSLATALMVLGPDEGLDWATQRDVAAVFVVRTGAVFERRATPAFKRQAGVAIR